VARLPSVDRLASPAYRYGELEPSRVCPECEAGMEGLPGKRVKCPKCRA
jgi:rubredoxin